MLGFRELELREEKVQVSRVLDPGKVIERIAYYYLKTAKANLVEDIDSYQLLYTCEVFNTCPIEVTSTTSSPAPWIRLPHIKRLKAHSVGLVNDYRLCEELTNKARRGHAYTVHPNFWMKAFGISDAGEIARFNGRIRAAVVTGQKELAVERTREGFTALGAKRLWLQEVLAPHTPKKHQRRNFVLSSIT